MTNSATTNDTKLDDNTYEKLLRIISHYTISELEEIVPFGSKSDEDREQITKVALKSIETTTIIMHEFLNANALNLTKVDTANDLLKNNKLEEAYTYIFNTKIN